MNRDYIDWLETLPCNRKPQKVNAWMGGGLAPLPEEIDLLVYEDRENQRNPKGVMSRMRCWIRRSSGSRSSARSNTSVDRSKILLSYDNRSVRWRPHRLGHL